MRIKFTPLNPLRLVAILFLVEAGLFFWIAS